MTVKNIAPTAKIIVLSKENPFAKGTGAFKRVQAVLASKSKAEALKRGARSSTVRYCLNEKLIKTA